MHRNEIDRHDKSQRKLLTKTNVKNTTKILVAVGVVQCTSHFVTALVTAVSG